jgi:hypothetical protein
MISKVDHRDLATERSQKKKRFGHYGANDLANRIRECTNFTNEVCEAALAHVIENKAEAAYRRGDIRSFCLSS